MGERRYDQNLQGLLRFAVEHTRSEDANNELTLEEMDENRKKFLEEAFASMSFDIKEEFTKAISTLVNDSTPTSEKLESLNIIRDLIDNIDFANSFAKMNGTQVLINLLQHENNEIRISTSYIIAEMSQNNTFCQKHFLEIKILPILISSIVDANKDVASSSIHAISSLIRNFEPGLVEFIKLSGLEKLVACLKTDNQKVFLKSCFLIATLSAQNSYVRDKFVRFDIITTLAQYIEPISEYDVKMDSLLFALAELSKSSNCIIDPQVKTTIQTLLKEFVDRCKNLPECEEMVANANSIITNLKKF